MTAQSRYVVLVALLAVESACGRTEGAVPDASTRSDVAPSDAVTETVVPQDGGASDAGCIYSTCSGLAVCPPTGQPCWRGPNCGACFCHEVDGSYIAACTGSPCLCK
jgi:hypothetical protein